MTNPALRICRRCILPLLACLAASLPAQDRPSTPRIGLVLSGGGARGASHLGVLKILEREGIPIDCIAATSMGALTGGLYALGYSPAEIEDFLSRQDWNSVFSDSPQRRITPLIERRDSRYQAKIAFRGWNPELPSGLWGGQRLTEALDALTTSRMLSAHNDFDRLPIRFRAVATNLIDGKPYIFKKGSMTRALRASIAVPMMFTPLETDETLLVDGGLVNNLPTDVARAMGADIVIAVDATSPLLEKEDLKTFFDVIDQSISLQMEKNVRENTALADIVLKPDLANFTNTDYDKIAAIRLKGEEEAVRRLHELKSLVAGIPPRRKHPSVPAVMPIIDAISFRGLRQIPTAQVRSKLSIRPGDIADPETISAEVSRIYATRLFESVAYALEPAGDNRYHLSFLVKEDLLHTLGAGLRYDNDYNFVMLAEFTARQMFHTPSKATVSTQFGGLEHHSAALRFIPPQASFLFLEPRVDALRLERWDVREKKRLDKFTDMREGGQLLLGGSLFGQMELAGGYHYERIRISGGSEPNRMDDAASLAGITLRFNWDSLDYSEFPRSGAQIKFQGDRHYTALGGDFDYSKLQMEYRQYVPVSEKSTLQLNLSTGLTSGAVPFHDLFFTGGFSRSEKASRPFLGFGRDEMMSRQMGIVGASYSWQLFAKQLSLFRRGYVTAIYNGGFFSTRPSSPYRFDYRNGAGLSVSADTMLGPVRIAGGWGEGGRLNFYFSFGPSF